MDYVAIALMPTKVMPDDFKGSSGMHESCLRAYQILGKVKWLLEKKTDPEVITELIRLMETMKPQREL